MRKKITVLCLILIPLLMLSACTQGIKPYSEMSSTEKLTYMYQVYNSQHEDYMIMSGNPNLTETQKEVLRAKKPILESLQMLIPAYDQSIQSGAPSYSQEQQIYNLLTKIQAMVPQ